jgi:phosphate transport system substrate-binding protein
MRLVIALTTLTILFFSCQDKDRHGRVVDTPTTGAITIVADESLQPIVEAEVATFNALHPRAKITALYLPEADAISAMLNEDTIKCAIVTRRLTADEKKFLMDQNKIRAREEDLATSGIALIVNNANPDTTITIEELRSLLRGEKSKWSELGGRSNAGIEIVFDNANSGLIRQLRDSVAKVDSLPKNCFAVKNNQAVIDHVSKNENALGLIGLEWISDKDDTLSNSFLDKVKVVALAGDSTHFQPYQAYLALKYYPLSRTISAINREGRTGLATGFVAFFASERGQRIILKAGLVPKTMPVRIVEVNPKPFEIEK